MRHKNCWTVAEGLALSLLLVAAPLLAQSGTLIDMGTSPQQIDRPGSGDGFLFSAPKVTLELRGGISFPRASSDVFTLVDTTLTLSRSDFNAITGVAEVGVRINDRFSAIFDLGIEHSGQPSEYRNYLDQNNQPIQQHTSFTRVPLTAGLKAYLVPAGRSVGDFAWLPNRLALYVGAAGGLMHYQFTQQGDFVDLADLSIFGAKYSSSDWAPIGQLLGGAEITVTKHLAADIQTRYTFGSGKMSNPFVGFDRIDLNGLQTSAGLSWRL